MTAVGGDLVRRDPIDRTPVLFLWPYSSCNCRCVMCDIWKDPTRKEISPEIVAAWRKEWRRLGVKQVVLTGGEALLHSRFEALCEALRETGVEIMLLSTGLTLERNAQLVARTCQSVRVSLDGPRAVHDQIRRVPRAYERLGRGVAALKAVKSDLPIIARSAIHALNYRHLPEIVDAARQLGLDGVSFLGTDVSSDAFMRDGQPSAAAQLLLSAEQVDELTAIVDRLADDRAEDILGGFIREGRDELHARLSLYYRAQLGAGAFPGVRCNAPWVSAVIEHDGAVRPCFFLPSYGNVFEAGSLSAVINGEAARAFRQDLDVARNPTCQRCVCSIALPACSCGLSRDGAFCDRTCLIADLLNPGSALRQLLMEPETS